MAIQTIEQNVNWGDAADSFNNNFSEINTMLSSPQQSNNRFQNRAVANMQLFGGNFGTESRPIRVTSEPSGGETLDIRSPIMRFGDTRLVQIRCKYINVANTVPTSRQGISLFFQGREIISTIYGGRGEMGYLSGTFNVPYASGSDIRVSIGGLGPSIYQYNVWDIYATVVVLRRGT